jgi:hypothetical protein
MKLFHPPSTAGVIILIPIVLFIFFLNLLSLIDFIKQGYLTNQEKLIFSIKVIFLMAGGYLVTGYYYLKWAVRRKNELLHVVEENRDILYVKYGRIMVNKSLCEKISHDPLRFTRLSQSDLKDVTNKMQQMKCI